MQNNGNPHKTTTATQTLTIEDVCGIQGLLLLLKDIHIECGSVSHLIITVHHTPIRHKHTHALANCILTHFVVDGR